MIVEERTYTLHPGKVPEYLALYEREGLALQRAALGTLVGYFSTEVGTLNQVVHLWAYQDLEDRSRRRAELLADPDWQAYFARIAPLLQRMESRLLVPAPFSPLGGTR